MKSGRYLFAIPAVLAAAIAASTWNRSIEAAPPVPNVPRFQVDPTFPKPLPNNWVTADIGGTCIDFNPPDAGTDDAATD